MSVRRNIDIWTMSSNYWTTARDTRSSDLSYVNQWIRDICDVEGYTLRKCIEKYDKRFQSRFGLTRYYEFLYANDLEDFIKIEKSTEKAAALIELIRRGGLPHPEIRKFYPQFKEQYKIYLQCHMIERDIIPLTEFNKNMVGLCGTPILNSKLITSKYIGGEYLKDKVYSVFYSFIKGEVGYKKWVGLKEDRTNKQQRTKYSPLIQFNVNINSEKQIPYLIDVMESGIHYFVKVRKNFISKSNMEALLESLLSSNLKPRQIPQEVKGAFFDAVQLFSDEEKKDMDQYVFKLRSISKDFANRIAKNYKEECVGYTTYKGLKNDTSISSNSSINNVWTFS